MDLGIYFDNGGSIRAPVPDLLVSMGIDVESGQEGLDITFVLDVQKSSIEVLSKGYIIFVASLNWCLSDSSNA